MLFKNGGFTNFIRKTAYRSSYIFHQVDPKQCHFIEAENLEGAVSAL